LEKKNDSPFTINLSSTSISENSIKLLDKGLSFIPTYNKILKDKIIFARNKLIRNTKLHSYFFNSKIDYIKEPFTPDSNWVPPDFRLRRDIIKLEKDIIEATDSIINKTLGKNIVDYSLKQNQNLSAQEIEALLLLKNDNNIIIKKADKGGATVIMDLDNYLKEGYRQLNDTKYYKKIDKLIYPEVIPKINRILARLKNRGFLSLKQLKFLTAKDTGKHRYFYMLPKIHKEQDKWTIPHKMPPGRPIVSDVNSESRHVTKYIDSFLNLWLINIPVI